MKLFLIFVTATLIAACASSDSTDSSGDKIHWSISAGSGGGFTAMTTGYTLSKNGEVYKWSGANGNRDNSKKIGTISRDDAEQFSKTLTMAGFATTTLNSPGNMTTFIEMDRTDGRHYIQWGSAQPPQAIAEWYTSFISRCTAMEK